MPAPTLQDFVLQRRDANRASHGLQFGLVLRRRHSVHTRRRVLAYSPVGFAHPYIVNMMRQRRQGQLRLPLSQLA